MANIVSNNIVSVGASLAHVHVPGRVLAVDDFNASQGIELGMGIHNEEGFKRLKTDLPGLVKEMLAQLLDANDKDRAYININPSERVVLLINNLGGVSVLELGGITEEVCDQLQATHYLKPERVLAGTFMSSLNGLGFSISILKIVDTDQGSGKSMLELLDAPAEATGWSAAVRPSTWGTVMEDTRQSDSGTREEFQSSNLIGLGPNPPLLTNRTNQRIVNTSQAVEALKFGLNDLIAAEPDITKYDTMVGDGDCGLCLKAGAEAVLAHLTNDSISADAVQFVSQIAHVLESNMDGTSGAIYAIFVNALACGLSAQDGPIKREATAGAWANALNLALESLGKYTPAKPGDRTVIDALQPFVKTLVETSDISKAAEAANQGCDSTIGMKASLGRSVYVGGEDWKTCPDPGAFGLAKFLSGLSKPF